MEFRHGIVKKKETLGRGEVFATLNVVHGSIAPVSPGGFLIMQTIMSHPRFNESESVL